MNPILVRSCLIEHVVRLFVAAVMLSGFQAALAQSVLTPGLLKLEIFDLSDREQSDLSLEPLLSHPTFPGLPAEVHYIRSFDVSYAYPDPDHDDYGSRITGLFIPPVSGSYVFYLRSDDASQLWFNPSGSSESGKIKILEEIGCCGLFSDLASEPFALVGGERYYIESVHREGPEYDYCQVAVKRTSDPTDPDHLFPISHEYLGIFAPADGAAITRAEEHSTVAVLPTGAQDPVLLGETFTNDDGGFTVSSSNPHGPWMYLPDSNGVWIATGHKECEGTESTALTSPAIRVEHSEPVYLVVTHRYSFEYLNTVRSDGGQIRLSLDQGAYAPVPAGNFIANGYTGVVEGNNLLTGQEAFTGTTQGHQSGYLTTTVARLGAFAPGTTLSLQFLAAWDECLRGDYPNWEISGVWVTHTVAQVSVEAAGSLAGVGNVPVAHTWQIDMGGGFANLGSIEETLWLAPTMADDGTRFRALLAIPGLSVFSEPVTLRLTREPLCSIGGPYVASCANNQAGLLVQLDGSESTDPDGGGLQYTWSTDCAGAVFDDSHSPTPTLFFGAGVEPQPSCRVTLRLDDEIGASITCSADVDISLSMVPPTLVLNGGDQQFVCDAGSSNQYIELGGTALDACGRPLDVIIGSPADTRVSGTQTVTYDAVDVFGNPAPQLTRTVVVQEGPLRLEDVPEDLVAECNAVGGISRSDPVIVDFLNMPQAVDDCESDETVVNDAPDFLPIGSTLVTWTVYDNGLTDVTASATITVQDTTEPTMECEELSIPADADGNAVVPDLRAQLAIADACTGLDDLTIEQTPAPGAVLPIGQHNVTVTVTDTASPPNTATCTTTLNVTAVGGDDPGAPGCGAPACGGNAMLSLATIGLGLMALKLRRRPS